MASSRVCWRTRSCCKRRPRGLYRFRAPGAAGSDENGTVPFQAQTPCGTCRACLDACPTGALVGPYRLDARRCLAYLTIERREAVPEEFRAVQGARIFGCDACQEACPWNRRTTATAEPAFLPRPGMNPMPLADVLRLDEAAFRARFADTPLARPGREGLLAQAAALGGTP